MSQKSIKEQAQDLIMLEATRVFENKYQRTENTELEAEIEKQFRRIEKLFGYDVGSWSR
jgi:hypothetical protein